MMKSVTVKINGVEMIGGTYLKYSLSVKSATNEWSLHKSYSEFCVLSDQLTEYLTSRQIKAPTLPLLQVGNEKNLI